MPQMAPSLWLAVCFVASLTFLTQKSNLYFNANKAPQKKERLLTLKKLSLPW